MGNAPTEPPSDPPLTPAEARPTPQRSHPDSTLSAASLAFWRKQSVAVILASLRTGGLQSREVGTLVLTADGTILNGNTRVKCLEENGYDLNKLWELVEPPKASSERFDDLFQ